MFKPALAKNIVINDIRLPTMMSFKLEGVRAEFTPKGLKSRPLKAFGNPWLSQHFIKVRNYCIEKGIYIEGEFYRHGLVFSEISSICRRKHHSDTGELRLHIFDCWNPDDPNLPFTDRHEDILRAVREIDDPNVISCRQWLTNSHSSIDEAYELALDAGFEGLCFRNPDEKYKGGRPTKSGQQFMRIKPDDTYDGVVIEIVERFENLVESTPNELGRMSKHQDKDMKRATGMAAVAVTQWKEGIPPVRVTLSRGLTDDDRRDIWRNRDSYIGKHIRFKGIPVPGMDQPRSPRFDDWRTDLD